MQRYDRNILIDKIGKEGQKKLINSKVLVAGTGGLGSGVIVNLACLGIGSIGLIDNDKLEITNLNRQFIHKYTNLGKSKVLSAKEWVSAYNPEINVETYQLRLSSNNYQNIISKYDIIIDCFDSFKSKLLLNTISLDKNIPLIHGGVTEFRGELMTIIPHKSACLRCLMEDCDENEYIVKGVISPVVSTIASLQVMEAVKLILGLGELMTNRLLIFNSLKAEFKELKLQRDENCPCCGHRKQ